MKPTVIKIGGSALHSPADLKKIATVVRRYDHPILVVSAFNGVTDTLDVLLAGTPTADANARALHIIREKHEHLMDNAMDDPQRRSVARLELDRLLDQLDRFLDGSAKLGAVPDFAYARILSYGERLSAVIVAHVLAAGGLPATVSWPERIGLVTDGEFKDASVRLNESAAQVCRALESDHIHIIPGFYGLSPDGQVTLLGRGGSDYAAAAIARCVDAASLDVWKDVNGFMSADPRQVTDARPIPRLTYREAAELSYFGARILHPRTIEPLRETGIPIRIFNFHATGVPEPLTTINGKGSITDDVIKSVTWTDDISILRILGAGVGIHPGILAHVTDRLNRSGINIKSVITAQTAINILLDRDVLQPASDILKAENLHAVESLVTDNDAGVVAVVGEGIQEKSGIAARVFGALAAEQINVSMIAFGATPVAAYFVVNRNDRERAVTAIHRAFFATEVTV